MSDPDAASRPLDARSASRLVLRVGLGILVALLVWRLADVLLLAFGAVLVAVVLRTASRAIETWTPVSRRWAFPVAGLLCAGLLAGFLYLLGAQLVAQASALPDVLRQSIDMLEERFGLHGIEDWAVERMRGAASEGGVGGLLGVSSSVAGALADLAVVVAAGVFLAIRPEVYVRGFLLLVPRERRPAVHDTLHSSGEALRLWLLGQLVSMAIVGIVTGVGLWLLGVPSPLALGVLAAVSEFVPFAGPIIAAIPAVLLAASESLTTALWVIVLYTVVQQLEGNLITPIVQRHAVDLPPAVTILAIIAFGTLFGIPGILLATPLAVVCLVAVERLWVREVLGEDVRIPGEGARPPRDRRDVPRADHVEPRG